jgi:hypothetical protein
MNEKISKLISMYNAAVENVTDKQVVAAYATRTFTKQDTLLASHVAKNLQWFDIWHSFLKEYNNTCPPHVLDNLISVRDALFSTDVVFDTTELDDQVDKIFENIVGPLCSAVGIAVADVPQARPGIAVLVVGLSCLKVSKHLNYDQLKALIDQAWSFNRDDDVDFGNLLSLNVDLFADIDYVAINRIMGKLYLENPKAANEVKNGNVKAVGFFVGRVLKEIKVDPAILRQHIVNFCCNTLS